MTAEDEFLRLGEQFMLALNEHREGTPEGVPYPAMTGKAER